MEFKLERQFINENVLTISEVAKMLNVSRQMVREYVKSGGLVAAKKTPNGLLFLKEDVLQCKKEEYYRLLGNRLFRRKKIVGDGITRGGLAYFRENIKDYASIRSVHIYFSEYDALLDNYFTLVDEYVENKLIGIASPLFVLEFLRGEELWMNSCNCGYGGEGPHGSETILKVLGVPQKLIKELFQYKKISYFKENGEWSVETYETQNKENEDRIFGGISDWFYVFNENIVLLENPRYNIYRDGNKDKFIKKYIDFVPQPVSIKVFSEEEAFKRGRYIYNGGIFICYCVILKDRSGREIWFKGFVDERKSIYKQKTVQDILSSLGFDFGSSKRKWSDSIKEWMGRKLRWEHTDEINLEEIEH